MAIKLQCHVWFDNHFSKISLLFIYMYISGVYAYIVQSKFHSRSEAANNGKSNSIA